MALDPTSLTTLAAAKAQLEIDPADTSQDTFLTDAIMAATAAVETYCKRRFARSETVTETHTVEGGVLFLRRPPVEVVHEVRHAGEVLPPDRYLLFGAEGLVSFRPPTLAGTYQVSYSGGFVPPGQAEASGGTLERTLPRDIELACLLVVTTLYRARGRDSNLTNEALLSGRQSFADGWHVLSPAAQALLSPWRLSYP